MNQSQSTRQSRKRSRRSTKKSTINSLFLYAIPFVLINYLIFYIVVAAPNAEVTVGETDDFISTTAHIQLNSWFPTKEIIADLDGEAIEITKESNGLYSANIINNGLFSVTVTNLNGMSQILSEHVNILDDLIPTMTNAVLEDDILTLTITDSQSGIDFDSIYALDASQNKVIPFEIDTNESVVRFNMDTEEISIFAKDLAGNEAQAYYSPNESEDLTTASLE